MVMRWASLLVMAVGLAFVLPAAEVTASGECDGPDEALLPEWGAQDVPTNARLWLARYFYWYSAIDATEPELVLIGPEGHSPTLMQTRIELYSDALIVLTPDEALLPEAHYQLWSCDGPMCTQQVTEFTTGTGPDLEPPSLPVERDQEHYRRTVDLHVDFEGLLVVDLGAAALDPEGLTGAVHDVSASSAAAVTLGRGGCVDSWPGNIRSQRPLRYGAFDVAGNFSGWTEPETLAVVGCDCSTTRGRGSAAPLLLVLLAAPRRRRRPRGRREGDRVPC